MAGLVPFNRKYTAALPTGFEDFYNMLDDFFTDTGVRRNLSRDSFKIDVEETPEAYSIQAELPGVKKEEIGLELGDGVLTIAVKKEENGGEEKKNYIHRERRLSSVARKIHLGDARADSVKARLADGILCVTVEKERKVNRTVPIEVE